MATIQLTEWEIATPERVSTLRGVSLPVDPALRASLKRLGRQLRIRELRDGLEIETTSYVGSVSLGPVTLRVVPKIKAEAFAALLAYAVGTEQTPLPRHDVGLGKLGMQDLLVTQLAAEAAKLLARGMHRHYLGRDEWLSAPRGRVLFDRLARNGSAANTTLPCRHHSRDENILVNRVLLAGLQLGARLPVATEVRLSAAAAAAALADTVSPARLNGDTFRAVQRSVSRLTRAYEPALRLIELIVSGKGITMSNGSEVSRLPGFLFDMNRLFERALGRFLRESLPNVEVREQDRISDVFTYQPDYNPLQRRAAPVRPDFVFRRGNQVAAIADAKYRDLWRTSLPPHMLYQLSVYALTHLECPAAAILYPTVDPTASESRIAINDPILGASRARVSLRPANIYHLSALVAERPTASLARLRAEYATYLAFGHPSRDALPGAWRAPYMSPAVAASTSPVAPDTRPRCS